MVTASVTSVGRVGVGVDSGPVLGKLPELGVEL
jgi:hypothetical protein